MHIFCLSDEHTAFKFHDENQDHQHPITALTQGKLLAPYYNQEKISHIN
jgi:hypothetical protein